MATKILECDLVVLGAGGSGLVAAVKASEDSGKKVIVLEKAKKPGGATQFAGGPGVGNMSRMIGMPGASGGQSNPGSQDVTSQFTGWFTSKVGEENLVKANRMQKYINLSDPSIGPGKGGHFVVEKMVEFCQKQGIQILYETPARKFTTDAKGKVTGVLADANVGQLLVNCKACVIASGGFGRNYAKLQKYWPEEFNNKEMYSLCPPGLMGDGIDMAEEIGAYINQTKWNTDMAGGFLLRYPIHHPYSFSLDQMLRNGLMVYVNLDGKRWKNENDTSVSLASQPNAVAYGIADDDLPATIIAEMPNSTEMMNAMVGRMLKDPSSDEARAMKGWKEDLEYEAAIDEEGASGNHVKKANTLVELAVKMRIDPKVFVETIERYNKFCEAGKDLDFGKPAHLLKPIKKPPFWAIYGHRFSQCTKGLNGIAVNRKFEVLNPKGEPMPGLYAAGDTCTMYGGLVLQGSARRTSAGGVSGGAPPAGSSSGVPSGAPPAAGAAAASGGPPPGIGEAPGTSTASVNILSTEPSPCGGSSAAMMSGYSAGVHVAEYLKSI